MIRFFRRLERLADAFFAFVAVMAAAFAKTFCTTARAACEQARDNALGRHGAPSYFAAAVLVFMLISMGPFAFARWVFRTLLTASIAVFAMQVIVAIAEVVVRGFSTRRRYARA